MDKTFKEMMDIDLTPYYSYREEDKKKEAPYVSWAIIKKILHENGAEKVYYEPLVNEKDGSTLFASDLAFVDKYGVANRCYEVRVKVVVDTLEFVQNYPLLNGNNPVKDNSMNQLRVASAQARAFVKGVAIHTGLGFGLWCKNDDLTPHDVVVYPSQLNGLKELAQEEYTRLRSVKHMTNDDIVKKLGMANFEVLTSMFSKFDELKKFIEDMQAL